MPKDRPGQGYRREERHHLSGGIALARFPRRSQARSHRARQSPLLPRHFAPDCASVASIAAMALSGSAKAVSGIARLLSTGWNKTYSGAIPEPRWTPMQETPLWRRCKNMRASPSRSYCWDLRVPLIHPFSTYE